MAKRFEVRELEQSGEFSVFDTLQLRGIAVCFLHGDAEVVASALNICLELAEERPAVEFLIASLKDALR